jgi:CTP-dependent riboflavin kinase
LAVSCYFPRADFNVKTFLGTVTTGYGMATPNLHPVMSLIEARTGLLHLVPGTLNVTIPEEYIVIADALILPEEYPYNRQSGLSETIKLQRCLVAGHPGIIVRPDSHELGSGQFHGKACLELMGQLHFRAALHLSDGSTIEIQIDGSKH